MYYPTDMNNHLHYLYQQIEEQQQQIDQLHLLIDELRHALETLKKENHGRVEKVEYKFDQLKVERLEGTLNIGLTPNGGVHPSGIEEFTINRNNINLPTHEEYPNFYETIQKAVHHYLDEQCYADMQALEQQYNYQLESPYRNFIVEDIRNQIDQRIQYYLKDIDITSTKYPDKLKEMEASITHRVIDDIGRTMEEFIKHLPREEV